MARHHYLGVDYGEKRIGLALASDDLRVARPFKIIEHGRTPHLEVFRNLIHAYGITDIVVGLPRNLDGDDTAQTKQVRQFAGELERLGLPVILQDEAGTSELARQSHPDKAHIDDDAAAMILQDYLEVALGAGLFRVWRHLLRSF